MQTSNNISFGSRIVPNKLLKEAFTEFEQQAYGTGRYGKKITNRFSRSLEALLKDGSNDTYEIVETSDKYLSVVKNMEGAQYPCVPAYAHKEGLLVGNPMRFLLERLNSSRGNDIDLDTPLFLRWKDAKLKLQAVKTMIFGE